MKSIVTIDTGTTNTRAVLWQNNQVIAKDFEPVGVRETSITGSKQRLKNAIKKAIATVLEESKIKDHSQVIAIASGMITSELGLAEIPHLVAPVSIVDLSKHLVKKNIPDVFDQPIWFIPGVKNFVNNLTSKNITEMDVMRGEEVEVFGALEWLNIKGSCVLILPGSHTKIIKVDDQQRIRGSLTSMTGELIELLTKNSILAETVEEDFTDSLDETALKSGARSCSEKGLGQAAFSVRLLGMFTNYTRNQLANYLLGTVLENDIQAIKNATSFTVGKDDSFVILGKQALREALKILLENEPELNGHVVTRDLPELAGKGALSVAKISGID